jgi:hypothetical protein
MHRAKVGELTQMRHELRQLEELKAVEAEERVEHSQLQRIVRDLISSPGHSPSRGGKFGRASQLLGGGPVPSRREQELRAAYGMRSPGSPSRGSSRSPRRPRSALGPGGR